MVKCGLLYSKCGLHLTYEECSTVVIEWCLIQRLQFGVYMMPIKTFRMLGPVVSLDCIAILQRRLQAVLL